MPKLAINFDEVPDKFVNIGAGEYILIVRDIVIEPTKDQKGERATVTLEVDMEGNQFHGRSLKDYIGLKNQTNLKRLYWSCMGQRPGSAGFDTSELIGKHCKATIVSQAGTATDGSTREFANVREYICPA